MVGWPGRPNGYRYMSMAGAFGDRWAIRTQPSGAAAAAAEAAGDADRTRAAGPASKTAIIASRAIRRNNLMIAYLSSGQSWSSGRGLRIKDEDLGQQAQRARCGELDAERGRVGSRGVSGQVRGTLLVPQVQGPRELGR